MRKFIALVLCCLICVSFLGCGKSEEEEIVEEAIEELTEYWEDYYDVNSEKRDYNFREYLEIVNTQVFKITDTNGERADIIFKEIDYVVVFALLSNYLCSPADYVVDTGAYNCVVFYKDGRIEVTSSPFAEYFSYTYDFEFKGIDFERINLGDKFNKVLIDKKHK